jgi:porin
MVLSALFVPTLLVAAGTVSAGADASVDAAAGLRGSGRGEESLHASGLAHVAWESPACDRHPLGFSAYASVLWVEGRGPTERFLEDYMGVNNTEAYNSLRLYSWWLEASGQAVSLRLGALLADEEFAGTAAGSELINSAFGWPAFISANTLNTGPAYYAAALGARLAVKNDAGWSWQAGVYDGDSLDSPAGDDRPNRHGTHYAVNAGQGGFFITEVGYAPEHSALGVHAGIWHHSGDFTDLETGDAHGGNHGGYLVFERTLAGSRGQPGNIQAHGRYGFSPEDRSEVAWSADAAVAATGLWARRPSDVIFLGCAHVQLSSHLPDQDFERVWELGYAAVITDHFTIKPDLQYITHPGGSGAKEDSLLFTLRFTASY